MHFMICQECFCCATCVSPQLLRKMTRVTADPVSLTKCPFCVEGNVESIPIAENENYRFIYDAKRGLVMKFFR